MNLADHLMQDQNIVLILQVHLYKEYVGQYLKNCKRKSENVNKTIKINTKEEKKKMFEQQIKWMIRPHTHTHTYIRNYYNHYILCLINL